MINYVIRDLVSEIRGGFFSILCDEYTDINNWGTINYLQSFPVTSEAFSQALYWITQLKAVH